MTLRKRIDRLEGNSPQHHTPSQIVICGICPETHECVTAAIMGGKTLTRETDESEIDFMARVTAGAELSVLLPDNGR